MDGIALASFGIGGLLMFLALVLIYVLASLGTYLLAKKYEPSVSPILSWIPIINLYPLFRVAQISPWWIFGILASVIPFVGGLLVLAGSIYVYYRLALRLGRGVGTTVLLAFFSFFMLAYLGLQAHGRRTTLAWVLTILSVVSLLVGAVTLGIGAATQINSPEFQQGLRDLQDSPEFQEAMEKMKENPEFQQAMSDLEASGAMTGEVDPMVAEAMKQITQ